MLVNDFIVISDPQGLIPSNNGTAVPEPGAFSASLKVSSLNHALEYGLRLGLSTYMQNRTFEIGWSKPGFINAYLNSITTLTVNDWDVTSLKFVGKTNTLAIDISGVSVNATVDGGMTVLSDFLVIAVE